MSHRLHTVATALRSTIRDHPEGVAHAALYRPLATCYDITENQFDGIMQNLVEAGWVCRRQADRYYPGPNYEVK